MAEKKTRETTSTLPPRLWRWALAALVIGGLAGGATWGAAWLLVPENLPLEKVRIDGDIKHTRKEVLQYTLAGRISGSFFSLDLDGVRDAVEALPWVTHASVRRVWPNTLQVEVQERSALARWGGDSVVSPQGEVFTPDAQSVPDGLPTLIGPKGSAPEVVGRYESISRRLGERGFAVSQLELSDRHAWTLRLDDGLDLYLGNRQPEERLERVMARLPRLLEQGRAERIDARYTNGFAVQWAPMTETPVEPEGAEG